MLIFLIIVCIVGVLIFPYWLIPANPFPQPSGRWKVGTSELTWDSADRIGIIAKIWYPTNATTGINTPYIDNIDRTLAAMTGWLSPLFKPSFRRIIVPAFIDAPLEERSPQGFPLVLLSPGFGLMNCLNTFYALEFASHGFIVIGINHPGSSPVTLLADGSQVKFKNPGKEVLEDLNLIESFASKLTVEQANNISMVLDRFTGLNSTNDSFLNRRIDLNKVFSVGHSAGGTASFIVCGQDRRITKGVNLDGFCMYANDESYDRKKLLMINSDIDKQRPKQEKKRDKYDRMMAIEKLRIEQLSAKVNLKEISFKSSTHGSFTDLPIIIRSIVAKKIGFTGDRDGLELLSTTSQVMIDFFNEPT
jgi:Platelet-activating factor acetylhydrolase, isoform II